MKHFNVSLDVITVGPTKPDFFANSGIDLENLSNRKLREGTLWRLESALGEEASIEEQIESIFTLVQPRNINGNGIRAYLSIAVFYDTATCSVQIPPTWISLLHGTQITIEITCYPGTEKEGRGQHAH